MSIKFGKFVQSADDNADAEPIEWEVLKEKNGKALIISRYGLLAKPYNQERVDITWENCTLRKWLNDEFYVKSFTDEEKEKILTVTNINADNKEYHTKGGNDTEDKVFLLSLDEVQNLFPNDENRIREVTPYAEKTGAGDSCWWWLRSSGYNIYHAANVDSGGSLNSTGFGVHGGSGAVCPALWIDLNP